MIDYAALLGAGNRVGFAKAEFDATIDVTGVGKTDLRGDRLPTGCFPILLVVYETVTIVQAGSPTNLIGHRDIPDLIDIAAGSVPQLAFIPLAAQYPVTVDTAILFEIVGATISAGAFTVWIVYLAA